MKKCCVLIPYYNAGSSLLRSIYSIDCLAEGPDVVVVDDGSEEITAASMIADYVGELDIHIITLGSNKGIEHALNAGIDWCIDKYQYVARLDCGDLCKGGRIVKQLDFLEQNPEIKMVGAWVDYVDKKGDRIFTLRPPVAYSDIKKEIFLNSTFVHPAVMFRADVFNAVGNYPLNYPAAEDYALFFDIVKKFPCSNIPDVLLDYEVDPNSISSTKRKRQIKSRIRVILRNFNFSGVAFYGLVRSVLLYYTPRKFTVFANSIRYRRRGK